MRSATSPSHHPRRALPFLSCVSTILKTSAIKAKTLSISAEPPSEPNSDITSASLQCGPCRKSRHPSLNQTQAIEATIAMRRINKNHRNRTQKKEHPTKSSQHLKSAVVPLIQAPRSHYRDPHQVGLLKNGPQRVDRSLHEVRVKVGRFKGRRGRRGWRGRSGGDIGGAFK